ncbi:hypothetical protein Barb6XT_00975 [Bacteroidales bacterium Barb6XT]|nr:hypothetical protein Barb6XT_00975 [Bacteroidales bacterium Barb6XT]
MQNEVRVTFAPVDNQSKEMLRRRPEGTKDFSPTCSAAECGVYGMASARGSCKDDRITE